MTSALRLRDHDVSPANNTWCLANSKKLEILDFLWSPYFYYKDAYLIRRSSLYLLLGVRYKHLCDFPLSENAKIRHNSVKSVKKTFQNSNLS